VPHIVVKLYAGKSAEEKQRLADALSQALIAAIGSKESSISVAIEDVAPERWVDDVYKPEILDNPLLFKKPGYDPLG
jgi:4-oxalocrotonate tautomerase